MSLEIAARAQTRIDYPDEQNGVYPKPKTSAFCAGAKWGEIHTWIMAASLIDDYAAENPLFREVLDKIGEDFWLTSKALIEA